MHRRCQRAGSELRLRLAGALRAGGNDCHENNPNPDWGFAGNSEDDPQWTGSATQNIRISRPVSGLYAVGVHYFCDNQLGSTAASVRIYCYGAEAAAFGPTILPSSGAFWEVATLSWPGCAVQQLGGLQAVPRGCGMP